MSLLDLHKRATRAKSMPGGNRTIRHNTAVSADEFIDEAINYAQGIDNVVPLHQDTVTHPDQESKSVALTLVKGLVANKVSTTNKVPYRRATFTLSEQCIESLASLANHADCAKSQLVRMLIRQFDQLPQKEQQKILAQQKTRDR